MTNKFALGIEITADPAKAKAGLIETRKDLLATYGDAKAAVAKLNETLDQSRTKAAEMAKSMGTMEQPTRAMVADFEKAKAAVNATQAAVEKQTLAMQQARLAVRANADAIAAAEKAAVEKQALAMQKASLAARENAEAVAAAAKAANAVNFSKQLAAAQMLLDAENQLQREIRETAAARTAAESAAAAAAASAAARSQAAAPQTRNTAIAAAIGSLGGRGNAEIRGEIADAQRAVASLRASGAAASEIARASQLAQAKIAALTGELNGVGTAATNSQQSITGTAVRMAALAAAAVAAHKALELLKSSVDVGIKFDSMKTQFQFASGGDVKKAADEMAYASQLSNRLGLELIGTTQAYGKLQASSRGTALEGQKTRDIFTAVASAGAVMGLTAEQQSGALLAISQMMSKGTVSAEELRGQLGERLPTAFATAAKAMNVTEAELQKMLEAGQLTATQFLPRFAEALQASVSGALPAAEASARAQLQRLENAFTEFKLRIASSGLLDKVSEQLERLLKHIGDMADSGELERLASGFATAFGAAIKFMADATIFAERFAGVLVPLAAGLAAVMVGGKALALIGASAPALAAVGTAATASAGGVSLLAGALRMIPGLALGGAIIGAGAALMAGVGALTEWGAKATEARTKSDALDASIRKLIDTNDEYASHTRLEADALAEFGDTAVENYEKAIKGARDYASYKVLDLVKSNKNGQNDEAIAFYRDQAGAYNEYIDTVLAGEKLRRDAVRLTGQIQAKEAEREKLLAGEVKQTKAEAIAEQIKGYEKLVEAIGKAREESKKEAEEAKKKAEDLRSSATDKKTSAADKATQIREKDLSAEQRQVNDQQRALEAQSQGAYYAAAAASAQLDGRGKDFEKYTKQAEKFLDRAMKFAESAQDANLVEDIGNQQAGVDNAKAKAEDKKAADAEKQGAALMDQLNAAQAKLKELKGEAATIAVNAEIAGAIAKLSEVETKLAALDGKTATMYTKIVESTSSTAPADTSKMTRQELIDAIPARAYGGSIPGYSPHDRADNILARLTAGEHVMQLPAVRYYGRAMMDDINHMRLPRYAFGGAVGRSAVSRLSIPRMSPQQSSYSALQPVNVYLGQNRFALQGKSETVSELQNFVSREALRKGKRS